MTEPVAVPPAVVVTRGSAAKAISKPDRCEIVRRVEPETGPPALHFLPHARAAGLLLHRRPSSHEPQPSASRVKQQHRPQTP